MIFANPSISRTTIHPQKTVYPIAVSDTFVEKLSWKGETTDKQSKVWKSTTIINETGATINLINKNLKKVTKCDKTFKSQNGTY